MTFSEPHLIALLCPLLHPRTAPLWLPSVGDNKSWAEVPGHVVTTSLRGSDGCYVCYHHTLCSARGYGLPYVSGTAS